MSLWLLSPVSIQVEELKSRLAETEKQTDGAPENTTAAKENRWLSNGVNGSPPALPEKPLRHAEVQKAESTETQKRDSVPATGVIVGFYFHNIYHLRAPL